MVSNIIAALTLLVSASLADNINGFTGCSNERKDIVWQAYRDCLALADNVNPFRGERHDELPQVTNYYAYHELADRFFGGKAQQYTDKGEFTRGKVRLIKFKLHPLTDLLDVIYNIRQWYPWPVFDWIWGRRIEVRCEDVENRCVGKINGRPIGAYASNTDSGPKITFCDSFWEHPNLAQRRKDLDGTPDWRKHIGNFKTQGEIFLHEMTHLLVISGERKSEFDRILEMVIQSLTIIVIDYKWDGGNARAYGPKKCAKLARSSDREGSWDAATNADSYGTSSWQLFEVMLTMVSLKQCLRAVLTFRMSMVFPTQNRLIKSLTTSIQTASMIRIQMSLATPSMLIALGT